MELALRDETSSARPECANCGSTDGLLRCSRCHTAFFCGVACQKAYWPFHRLHCKRNEFADAMEEADPKFAEWMRAHGKMAVLKDDEVDRLERAAQATSGPSRQDVLESMYGRADPRPLPPAYSPEEVLRLETRAEETRLAARRAGDRGGETYRAIAVPTDLGREVEGGYKWRQTQTHVDVFVPVRPGTPVSAVDVTLTPSTLAITIDERPVLRGRLWREIKAEESTWYVQDGVLEICMLKRHRRGNYTDGEGNATTFWFAVVHGAPPEAHIALEHPPTKYYSLPCEDDDGAARDGQRREIQRRRRLKAAAQSRAPATQAIAVG